MNDPPDPPADHIYFPPVVVGSVVYLCGGSQFADNCYTMDMRAKDFLSWKPIAPVSSFSISGTSGVAVGTHIWYMEGSKLQDYNTITESKIEYDMPFFNEPLKHCFVANATHGHVVGAGRMGNQVWVNIRASDPAQWILVAVMPITYPTCVLYGKNIHIQGGFDSSWKISNGAFALNINTYSLQKLASMTISRVWAEATILDDKVAVVGGVTRDSFNQDEYLKSIETYDGTEWTLHELSLKTPRSHFGLAWVP